jgi:hypothetical protein
MNIIQTNGISIYYPPANGKDYTLEEAQKAVDGLIEVVELKNGNILICNEEAIIRGMDLNPYATQLAQETYGEEMAIFGDVIYCPSNMLR